MKRNKTKALLLAVAMALCLCSSAFAATTDLHFPINLRVSFHTRREMPEDRCSAHTAADGKATASVSEDLFRAVGILPSIVVKSESSDLCLSLCTAGVGAMITSDGWARWKLSHWSAPEASQFCSHGIAP